MLWNGKNVLLSISSCPVEWWKLVLIVFAIGRIENIEVVVDVALALKVVSGVVKVVAGVVDVLSVGSKTLLWHSFE